ncbi:MAG TPA: SDR family NAD(P)-dependent oxidoreductase [Gemmataceae bacterium]|jgi:short-subunit dehydrogenase|nr:SDR family NAD(P)-dependent oxidoreductase [Gemmataceae bacterium]
MGHRRQIAGSRILITGASQGIGRALAIEAARRGAMVLATARGEAMLRELESESGNIKTLRADVTSAEDRQAMADAMFRLFGGLDVLVNNAGIGATGHFGDATEDRLRHIFEVNFFGLAELTRICLPLLKKGNRPAVVNISSIVGKRGLPGRSEYSASKFAVQGLSEALRAEFSNHEIDVLVVNPGLTQTNFPKNMLERKSLLQVDHMRGMTAQQVAKATLAAMATGKDDVTLTTQGKLFVFASRFFPRLVDRIAARRVRKLYAAE